MTTQAEHRVYRTIRDNGDIEVTAVNHETGEAKDYTFTNYDEAIAEIQGLEYENEVYF